MDDHRQDQQLSKTRPLKLLYPDLELRKKFAAQKLEQSKGHGLVFVRCEPHPTHCHITNAPCLNVMVPSAYELAYMSATIHTKVVAKHGSNTSSTYLFCQNKLLTAFREKMGTFWQQHKEEDNILYLSYAETAPF